MKGKKATKPTLQAPIKIAMVEHKGYPFMTITHNLHEGTVTTSFGPNITDDQMEKIGYIIRVALFNFADILNMKHSEGHEKEMMEQMVSDSVPPTSQEGVGNAYR